MHWFDLPHVLPCGGNLRREWLLRAIGNRASAFSARAVPSCRRSCSRHHRALPRVLLPLLCCAAQDNACVWFAAPWRLPVDPARFDRITKALTTTGTRRGVSRLLTGLPRLALVLGRLGDDPDAAAEDDDHGSSHRRRRRRTRHKHRGQNRRPRGKGKGGNKKPGCTRRSCPANTCGSVADGCGGTMQCGCGANRICDGGTCRACTVTCPTGADPVARHVPGWV